MPPSPRTPRDAWVAEGLRALGAGGPDAVRVEGLAQALGVTKGGFYGHFRGRGDLLEEMLDAWERVVVDQVITLIDAEPGDGREKLRRLFGLADAVLEAADVELAIRDWARRDPAVAARLLRVDNRRITYMRSLFATFCADEEEVEARCFVAMAIFVGDRLIVAEHPGRTRAQVRRLTAERLLK